MDDAKNFMLGVMQTLKDRFGNPLISSVVISWCLWNNHLLIVLLSSGEGGWRSKLEYINDTLYPSGMDKILDFLIAPLTFAVIWIYLLPNLLSIVAIHHEKTSNRNRRNLLDELEKRPISEEDRKILLETMLKEKNSFLKQKAELSASYTEDQVKIAQLSELINKSAEEIANIKKEKDELSINYQQSVDRNNELLMRSMPSIIQVDITQINEIAAKELLSSLGASKRIGKLLTRSEIIENRYLDARYPIISRASFKDKRDREIINKDEAYDQETIAFLLIMSNDENIITSSVTYDGSFYTTLESYGLKNVDNTLNNLFSMNFISNVSARGFTTTPRAVLTGQFFSRLGFSLVLDPESIKSN